MSVHRKIKRTREKKISNAIMDLKKDIAEGRQILSNAKSSMYIYREILKDREELSDELKKLDTLIERVEKLEEENEALDSMDKITVESGLVAVEVGMRIATVYREYMELITDIIAAMNKPEEETCQE